MYAYESPQFNSGMLAQYLTTELARIGRASGLALLLLSRINWQRDADEFGPRGTVNHLTVRKMAVALGCSISTVQEHLALLRSAGIIESEPVADRKGSICYCRMWFSGFVTWLQRRSTTSTTDSQPPTGTPGQGGSEKPEGNHNTKSQTIIDLELVKSVRFSALEAVIREAGPKLSDGKAADCEMVFERFRLFNLKQGKSRISLAALRGFARSFTDFRGKPALRPPQSSLSAAANEARGSAPRPAPAPRSSYDAAVKERLKAVSPKQVFDSWLSHLSFDQVGGEVRVAAPTGFISNYVRTHFDGLIRDVAGQGARVVFA